jgi:hypothetical protein
MNFRLKHNAALLSLALAAIASPVALTSASAMSASDCLAAWNTSAGETAATLPIDKGARYYAALRVSGKAVEDGKLTKADFLAGCQAGTFDTRAAEAGAPLKGANSFTESQAKDRAMSHGVADVSKLEKDADGIWRGTGTQDGKAVKLAVDFKGNVVVQK